MRNGTEQHLEPNKPAPDGIAEAIDADVYDRLDGPFLGGRNWRIEKFVACAKPRPAEDRLPCPRHRKTAKAGGYQAADASCEQRDRRRARGQAQAKSL